MTFPGGCDHTALDFNYLIGFWVKTWCEFVLFLLANKDCVSKGQGTFFDMPSGISILLGLAPNNVIVLFCLVKFLSNRCKLWSGYISWAGDEFVAG